MSKLKNSKGFGAPRAALRSCRCMGVSGHGHRFNASDLGKASRLTPWWSSNWLHDSMDWREVCPWNRGYTNKFFKFFATSIHQCIIWNYIQNEGFPTVFNGSTLNFFINISTNSGNHATSTPHSSWTVPRSRDKFRGGADARAASSVAQSMVGIRCINDYRWLAGWRFQSMPETNCSYIVTIMIMIPSWGSWLWNQISKIIECRETNDPPSSFKLFLM